MTPEPATRFDLARIGAGLPFAEALEPLADAVGAGGVAVVQAPPGTGKTTLLPPALSDVVEGRVVVTGPRRIVVRAAARRLAKLDGSQVGDRVGFTVRGERQISAGTRVEFVTPGVLLRRLLRDPDLPGVAAVVLDEVHERGLDTDLLVGMLAEVRELRPDLVLVAMSATLDAERFAGLLGGDEPAPVVACAADLHPLEVRWAPPPGLRSDARGVTPAFLDHVANQVRQVSAERAGDDVLVFLPGVREVTRVADRLRGGSREVLELHGRLTPAEQDRVTAGRRPGERGRIVVSTALAESSITVPGVRVVVDAGLSREPRRDAARRMTGLVTVSCSRDAAQQRAGRAARLGPGIVVRCYDEDAFARMPAHVAPEIASADLTGAALTLACWGAPGGVGLALPDPPPPASLADAVATLRAIGAVDDAGRATDAGRRWADLPVDPRLARALLLGGPLVGDRLAAEVVAAVSADLRAPSGDLVRLLTDLRAGRMRGAAPWSQEVERLRRLGAPARGVTSTDAAGAGLVVALAWPDRIARRSGDTYLFASGTRAALPPDSGLAGQEWLAVADVGRVEGRVGAGTGAVIRLAAPIDQDVAERAGAGLLTDDVQATWRDGRVTARRVRALGAIELAAAPVSAPAEVARRAVADALAERGMTLLTWSDAADALRRRLAFLHTHLGDPWPDVGDAALLARLDDWLGPELDALATGTRADRLDLRDPLRRLLPWPAASRLDELAPERLQVASSSRVRITYPPLADADARPVVAVKLQECFGWAASPRLADGRVPVLFHLLSPAGRPLAVTDDLASFWSGPYLQVRAEMRGRYPRHPWPLDPWTAPATSRTTKRAPKA